mmetsp:Transcript_29517/g.53745  ORF Transcript_29517/g.53745 Transcript_29517/m.53745 type:complete len:427 (+) Transcript_29517:82-1362(+)
MATIAGDENAKPQDVNVQEVHMMSKLKAALSRPRGQKRARAPEEVPKDLQRSAEDDTTAAPPPKHRRLGIWLGGAVSRAAEAATTSYKAAYTKCGEVGTQVASGYKCSRVAAGALAGKVIDGPEGGWSTVRQAFKTKVAARAESGRVALASKLKAMRSSLGSVPSPAPAPAPALALPPCPDDPTVEVEAAATETVEAAAEEASETAAKKPAAEETVEPAPAETFEAAAEEASETVAEEAVEAAPAETVLAAPEAAMELTVETGAEETLEAQVEETVEAAAEEMADEDEMAVAEEIADEHEEMVDAAAGEISEEDEMAFETHEAHTAEPEVAEEAADSDVVAEITADPYQEVSDEAPDSHSTELENADPFQEDAHRLQQIWMHHEELDVEDDLQRPVEAPFIDASAAEISDVPRPCISEFSHPSDWP